MSSSSLIFFVGFITFTKAELGPCTQVVTTDPDYDLEKFANERNGQWKFWLVPEQWHTFTYLDMDPSDNKDEYRFAMYQNNNYGKLITFLDGNLKQTGIGKATFKGEAGGQPFTFEMSFLKYVPNRYAYYYVCSNQDHDLSTDYRYVVTHGPLNKDEEVEINNIDKQYKFKGTITKNKALDAKGDPKKSNKLDENKGN